MLRGPSLHLFRLMGPQPIHDQEVLSGRLAQHSLQERNKQCGRHRLFVGHEVDRSPLLIVEIRFMRMWGSGTSILAGRPSRA